MLQPRPLRCACCKVRCSDGMDRGWRHFRATWGVPVRIRIRQALVGGWVCGVQPREIRWKLRLWPFAAFRNPCLAPLARTRASGARRHQSTTPQRGPGLTKAARFNLNSFAQVTALRFESISRSPRTASESASAAPRPRLEAPNKQRQRCQTQPGSGRRRAVRHGPLGRLYRCRQRACFRRAAAAMRTTPAAPQTSPRGTCVHASAIQRFRARSGPSAAPVPLPSVRAASSPCS